MLQTVPMIKHANREAWLQTAVELFKPFFAVENAAIPPVHVSTGWPSSRGTSQKRKALGEAWDKSASADGRCQIFISPFLSDPRHADRDDRCGVLPTLAHELVHAVKGNKAGHGPEFRRLALAIGLEGKMTSTHAGDKLMAQIDSMLEQLGDYPHAKITPGLSGKKKQGTRMIKCECGTCGYTVRTTKKWLEMATPRCPISGHGAMNFEMPSDEDGDEAESED